MLYKCGKLQLFTSLLQHHGGSWALIRPTLDGNRTFQERQRLQRQAKKKYLKFYGALCAQSLRQLTAGQSRRPAW